MVATGTSDTPGAASGSSPALVGRSSSLFTRVARIFAFELGVEHEFRIVHDLLSCDRRDYADNPALKIPVLVDREGPLFGTENVCRALALCAGRTEGVILRGQTTTRIVANAEELVLHVMNTEVSLIMAKLTAVAAPEKARRSVEMSLDWLDDNVYAVRTALSPSRAISFFEAALFCTIRHLPFREVMSVESWTNLCAFAEEFGARPSARATEFRFDARP